MKRSSRNGGFCRRCWRRRRACTDQSPRLACSAIFRADIRISAARDRWPAAKLAIEDFVAKNKKDVKVDLYRPDTRTSGCRVQHANQWYDVDKGRSYIVDTPNSGVGSRGFGNHPQKNKVCHRSPVPPPPTLPARSATPNTRALDLRAWCWRTGTARRRVRPAATPGSSSPRLRRSAMQLERGTPRCG